VAELRPAEVILAGGDAGQAGEAARLLEAVRPQVEEQRLFRNVVFRFLLAPARTARLRSDPAAPELARAARAVAAETAPALPRHRDAGRPKAADAEIAELEQLTRPPARQGPP
jgi:hypothetical protein